MERSTSSSPDTGLLSRERMQALVLLVATALALYLCYLLVQPFVSAIAWALALAIVASPLYDRLARRLHSGSVAAGITIVAVAVVIVAPTWLVVQRIVVEASGGTEVLQEEISSGRLRMLIERTPILTWLEGQLDLRAALQDASSNLTSLVSSFVTGSVWTVVVLLVTLFILFYFLRDRDKVLGVARSLIPLSHEEADEIFRRVADTTYATLYGTLVVATVQGTLGGLMFWWLGLPAPLLWGVVMGFLAIIPVLGAFIIWIPAAILLALDGEWTKAVILTLWGSVVVGLIDNLLYPVLVGKRMRLHTLPVFIAIVGGLAVFGASGLILGPIVLAITDGLLRIWKKRTAHGRAAEQTEE